MRDLKDILAELNAAEKEYERKCREYGIEEKGRKSRAAKDDETEEG